MNNYQLDFYFFESCPFCQHVLDYIHQEKIKINYCDIQNERSHLEKLVQDTGRRTVPCLYIDNKPMHESRDILNWLSSNLNQLEKINS